MKRQAVKWVLPIQQPNLLELSTKNMATYVTIISIYLAIAHPVYANLHSHSRGLQQDVSAFLFKLF
jgi:hypothetical protein